MATAMKNSLTDDLDLHLSHADLFSLAPKNQVTPVSNGPSENPKKSYADAALVNHSTLLINELTFPEIVYDHSEPSAVGPNITSTGTNISTPGQTAIRNYCISISVNKKAYEECLNICKHSLIGRVILTKGERPWKMTDLKNKLQEIWQLANWRLISLGKGYFHILLQSDEDRKTIWSRGPIPLKPGILRLQLWTPGFNPWRQKSNNAQIWVRFHELSWDF